MTGQQLIDWIKDHNACDKPVVIQYRDDGGNYYGGEELVEPVLAGCKGDSLPYSHLIIIDYRNGNDTIIL